MDDETDAVIHRLKKRFGVESDGELAARLLVSRSTVANWRTRGKVPERYSKIADGAANWRAAYAPFGELSDIERAAKVVAIVRLIRDYDDIASYYRAFLERGYEAVADFGHYQNNAEVDLYNEMTYRDSENAFHCAQLMIYNELFSPEAAAAAAAEGVKHTSSFGKQWYRKHHPVAPV